MSEYNGYNEYIEYTKKCKTKVSIQSLIIS